MLTEFAVQAWTSGAFEIELTDAWLDRFAPPGERRQPIRPVFDAYAQFCALSDRVVLRSEVLAYGGRGFGRFHDLIGESGVAGLRELVRREEAHSPEAVHAELCFLPGSSGCHDDRFCRSVRLRVMAPTTGSPSSCCW